MIDNESKIRDCIEVICAG